MGVYRDNYKVGDRFSWTAVSMFGGFYHDKNESMIEKHTSQKAQTGFDSHRRAFLLSIDRRTIPFNLIGTTLSGAGEDFCFLNDGAGFVSKPAVQL